MYSELDVHTESVTDLLMEALSTPENAEPTIVSLEGAAHPTSLITAPNHDGSVFQITVTTEEIDPLPAPGCRFHVRGGSDGNSCARRTSASLADFTFKRRADCLC